MKMFQRILLALASTLLLLGCGADSNCETACEKLSTCGMLEGSQRACVRNCKEDPTVLRKDVRCLSESTCEEMKSCLVPDAVAKSCWETCSYVYDDCQLALQDHGTALDKNGCMSFCREKLEERQTTCIRRMACGRIGECL